MIPSESSAVHAEPAPFDMRALLVSARTGDRMAFANLVRLHQSSVYSIGYRMLGRRDAAEDLAQDVFLQLYRKLESIETLEHLGFWLRRVAANLAIDRLRHSAWSTPLNDDMPEPVAPQADDDPLMTRALAGLLGELAPAARAVMVLRY